MTARLRGAQADGPLPPPFTSDVVRIEPFDDALDQPRNVDALVAEPLFGAQPVPNSDGPHLPPPEPTDTARVGALLDADNTGVAVVTGDGRVLTANDVFIRTLGVSDVAELAPGSPGAAMLRSFLDHVPNQMLRGQGGTWHGEIDHHSLGVFGSHGQQGQALGPAVHLGRRTLRTTVMAEPLDGACRADLETRLSILIHDVTSARRQVAELEHRATHDQLTGLANRQHVLTHLTRVIEGQHHQSGHVAAIFVDVDHLKYVNDAFGHRAGDRLIEATAERLTQAVRPSDHVARIGGDEFLVVAPSVSDAAAGLALAERIRRALTGRLKVGDLDLEYSVSIGVALTDDELLALPHHDAATMLVSDADSAMYAAKEAGRGRSIIYTARMRSDARARAEVAARLARAVADDLITVEYQPVYSTVTGRAIAAEALVRWHHPRLGEMDPATFISIAEESGVIGRLGERVLELALDDLAIWQRSGRVDDSFSLHVNVSRAQLSSAGFVPSVLTMLHDRAIEPNQLVLEARETSLVGRAADVDRTIRSFRRAGIQVAVDNFGTGPKALGVMTDVGADMLKLDGSLALPAGSTDTDTRLVRAVILLAHALGMNVVAERVTTPEQLERLRAAGCDMVQGHLLAEAIAVELLDLESPAW